MTDSQIARIGFALLIAGTEAFVLSEAIGQGSRDFIFGGGTLLVLVGIAIDAMFNRP